MPYGLHLVPRRASSEVTVALCRGDGLSAPASQAKWPNWVNLVMTLERYIEPHQQRQAKAYLSAGKAVWLPGVPLSDADLQKLGL